MIIDTSLNCANWPHTRAASLFELTALTIYELHQCIRSGINICPFQSGASRYVNDSHSLRHTEREYLLDSLAAHAAHFFSSEFICWLIFSLHIQIFKLTAQAMKVTRGASSERALQSLLIVTITVVSGPINWVVHSCPSDGADDQSLQEWVTDWADHVR